MVHRIAAVAVFVLASTVAVAQQPIPLLPPPSGGPAIESSPLGAPPAAPPGGSLPVEPSGEPPPLPGAPSEAAPASAAPALAPPGPIAPPAAPAASRVFCNQDVTYHLADPAAVPARYRQYLGIFSDAAWTPAICAALIVENVQGDGTAMITYVFGPMGSGGKPAGGVLHGTGVVKDDALLFQNADGSQYQFKPYYTDLAGHWATPTGQSYDSVFKKAY